MGRGLSAAGWLALALLGLAGCAEDEAAPPIDPAPDCAALDACSCAAPPCVIRDDTVTQTAPVTVAPDPTLPAEVRSQAAHNNLDLVWHGGRLYFAFRTAPSHFASADARLYVVSTADQQAWRFEAAFHLERDLREPRFLSVGGQLWLYMAVLGTDSLAFEPGETRVSAMTGPGAWTEPALHPDLPGDFIPWRIRTVDGVGYLMGYTGGAGVYTQTDEPVRVYWLQTADGDRWAPVAPETPVVLEGGVSEADFALLPGDQVLLVGRNEAGDTGGFGSRICRGPMRSPDAWRCADDPRKYDSPLVIHHGERVWLVGRRNLTDTGHYDLGMTDRSLAEQWAFNQTAYWRAPKRCSLWAVDPEGLAVDFVADLPSAGDTCFASAVPLSGDDWLLYNYSSPFEDPDRTWRAGQNGPTFIYRTTLGLPR